MNACQSKMVPIALFALALFLTGMPVGEAGSAGGKEQKGAYRETGSDYIYYPASAESAFRYETTGSFAVRPMVLNKKLPIITQPEYFYAETPRIPPIRAPLPRISTGKGAATTGTPKK